MSEDFKVEMDEPIQEIDETYRFTKIDCLEDDDPIVGQGYVLLSFISPEGIMNCKTRGLKVRGVYDTYERANKAAKKLSNIDKNHHIFVGPVGKWLPWDPSAKQVEEEQYGNDELSSIMKKAHDSEMKNQLRDLNELAGRHKENMQSKAKQHEKRVAEKIKQTAAEYEDDQTEQERPAVNLKGLNRDRNAAKERIFNHIAEKKKQQEKELLDKESKLKNDRVKIREETIKVVDKQQNLEELRHAKEKIEENIKKMKEMYAEKTE